MYNPRVGADGDRTGHARKTRYTTLTCLSWERTLSAGSAGPSRVKGSAFGSTEDPQRSWTRCVHGNGRSGGATGKLVLRRKWPNASSRIAYTKSHAPLVDTVTSDRPTTRPLHERVREHSVTGRGSTIHEHLVNCGGGTAQVRVRVLAREKDEVNTRLREAIIIKRLRPELNTRAESDFVDLVF